MPQKRCFLQCRVHFQRLNVLKGFLAKSASNATKKMLRKRVAIKDQQKQLTKTALKHGGSRQMSTARYKA